MIWKIQLNQFYILIFTFIVFAIIGMNVFSKILYRKEFNSDTNFKNFHNSFFLTIKLSTYEQINDYIFELYSEEPYKNIPCVHNQSWDDYDVNGARECGGLPAYFFFKAVIYFICYAAMNLTIGLFIDALNKNSDNPNQIIKISDIDKFRDLWFEYDEESKGWITVKQFSFFCYELPESFNISTNSETEENIKFDHNYEIKQAENEFLSQLLSQKEDPKEEIGHVNLHKTGYVVNYKRKLLIRETQALKLLNNFHLDVYHDDRVYYKDVINAIIRSNFDLT